MATGFSPNPRGGWTISTTLPACRAASTISPSGSRLRSTNSSPGRRPPVLDDRLGELGAAAWRTTRGSPRPASGPDCPPAAPSVSQSWSWPPRLDQRVDQRVAVAGRPAPGTSPIVVPRVTHRAQQRDRAGRGVQPDGVADTRVLGGICREHQRHSLVGAPESPAAGRVYGDPGDAGAAFRIGDVGGQTLVVDLLERERNRDDAAVELRHRDLGGDVERRQPSSLSRPGARGYSSGTGPAGSGCPGRRARPRSSCRRRRRPSPRRAGVPAGGEHGGHHCVGGAEQRRAAPARPSRSEAQNTGSGRPPASSMAPAQRLDEAGVARHVLGAVVEHRDGRDRPPLPERRRGRGRPRSARGRRLEAEAGHQHRVAEEGVQLPQIRQAALREIDVGLQRDAGGRRRMPHQLGVRRLLTADDDGRHTACHHGVDAVLPGAVARQGCARRRCRRRSSSSSSSPSTSRDGFAHR